MKKRFSKYENFLVDLTVVAMLNPNLNSKKLLPKELEKYYVSAKNFIKSKIPHQFKKMRVIGPLDQESNQIT